MVYGQQFWPLKGQRPQERPKTILACGSRAELAEVGRLQQPQSLSAVHAHCCDTVHFTWLTHHTVQENSCSVHSPSGVRAHCTAVHSVHFTWLPTTLCRSISAQCTLLLPCPHALQCTQCTSPGCPPHCAGIFLLSSPPEVVSCFSPHLPFNKSTLCWSLLSIV